MLAIPSARASALEGIAGWEGDGHSNGYGFAILGSSIAAGAHLSIPVRASGSYLYYDYNDGGDVVRVRGPGAAMTVGIRRSGEWGSVTLAAGGEVRWEHRDRLAVPEPTGVVVRGGVLSQAEGEFACGRRTHPFFLVNYAGAARYTYARGGVRWQVSNLDWKRPLSWSLGLEGVGQGNRDTDARQVGGTVECALVPSRVSLSLHGGYKTGASSAGGRRHGGYLGAGFYRRF